MIIAIDGPAAAGKGTLARKLATHYGFAFLDTGSLYRAVALATLRAGSDPDKVEAVLPLITSEIFQFPDHLLRIPDVSAAASIVSAHVPVRAAILDMQRQFAHTPPGGEKGAVLDGRDIGTVVCPDADAKLFVTARAEIRAHRRWLELKNSGSDVSEAQVLEETRKRDHLDETRAASPLKPTSDAHLLDTSDLSIEAAFDAAVAIIDKART